MDLSPDVTSSLKMSPPFFHGLFVMKCHFLPSRGLTVLFSSPPHDPHHPPHVGRSRTWQISLVGVRSQVHRFHILYFPSRPPCSPSSCFDERPYRVLCHKHSGSFLPSLFTPIRLLASHSIIFTSILLKYPPPSFPLSESCDTF